jgi:hypothetical protein
MSPAPDVDMFSYFLGEKQHPNYWSAAFLSHYSAKLSFESNP